MRGLLVLLAFLVTPVIAAAEQVDLLRSEIAVQPDGSLQVVETIQYDFAELERRGIYRTIPLQHPQDSGSWYRDRVVEISLESVERNGATEPYTLTGSGNTFRVRIGDADTTITGSHTYTLTYTVAGALTYYPDGSVDVYWNVTGDEWDVPIARAESTVTAPSGALLPEQSCYVGPAGAENPCADVSAGTTSVIFAAAGLPPGEGLTIAQSLEPTLIAEQIRTKWNLWWLWLSVGLLWLLGLGVAAYRFYTHYNPDQTVVPQYEPYQSFKPMFTGVLIDGQLQTSDITAGLLYLAEQGFIHIKKTERKVVFIFETSDYEVTLRRDPSEAETEFQRELLTLIFGTSPTVGEPVALSSLKSNQSKQRENRKVLERLRKGVDADLQELGFYEKNYQPLLKVGLPAMAVLLVVAVASVVSGLANEAVVVGAFILSVLTTIVLTAIAKRRTVKGYEARNYLRGFKEFLSVTGADRFAFHDAPEKSPEQFTQYLPYAVAFGVEKEWAKVFEDITIPEPSWYDGGHSGSTFAATALANDLGSFSQTFSQSSGSSASSGGGSAGGGAGGGGGGSW